MWTIIYQENGKDKWDRLESKDDVKNLLKTLRDDPGVCFDDVWIFTPDADDHTIDPNDLLFDNNLLTMLSNCLRTQGYSFTESQLKELYSIYTDCQKWDDREILTGLTCDEVTDFVENSTCVKDILFKQHDAKLKEFLLEQGMWATEIDDVFEGFNNQVNKKDLQIVVIFESLYELGENYLNNIFGTLNHHFDAALNLTEVGKELVKSCDEYLLLKSGRVVEFKL